MTRVNWVRTPQRVQWLGAYTGYDKLEDNELVKEIISRRGAVDEESLKAYGKVGGTVAGAALCAATGVGAAVAVGCGIVGGIIGEWVASKIPVAHGSTMEDLVSDTINKMIKPRAKKSTAAILSVKAYLTMRDLAITKGLATDASLTAAGCPPAPVDKRWAPNAQRYSRAKSNYSDVLVKLAQSSAWKKECAAAKNIKVVNSKFTCQDYLYAVYYDGYLGPVAPASDPIDWYAVGRDEVAFHFFKYTKDCDSWISSTPFTGTALDPGLKCPGNAPTTLAKAYLEKLNKTVKWPKKGDSLLPGLPDLSNIVNPQTPSTPKTNPVVVVGGLAAAAAALWYFFL
jgi:hypothetical protein